jgi:LAO/AO transport system kinase
LTGEGIPELWKWIGEFYQRLQPSGDIGRRRQQQALDWLTSLINDELQRRFYEDPQVRARLPALQEALLRGETTAARAARELLAAYESSGAGSR